MTRVMPEFIGRLLIGILGEALAAAIFAAVARMYKALPLPVRMLFPALGYALLFSMYLVVFLFCAVAVVNAETLGLRVGAALLGAYCSFEIAMLIRKVLR
jgi:hypothetical protein